MNKKHNTIGLSTQIRKIYVKEDNSLNKISLFLSGLAIALIVLLLINFKGLLLSKKVDASTLSEATAIEEIYKYIDSLDGFSNQQRQVLDSIIKDYINNCDVVTEDNMTVVYSLIDEKYQINRSQMEDIKHALEEKLNATSVSDSVHYSQLNQLIFELNSWLASNDENDKNTKSSFTQTLADLRAYTEKNDEGLNKLIETLADNTNFSIEELTKNLNEKSLELNTKIDTKSQNLNNKIDTNSKDLNNKIDANSKDLNDKLSTSSQELNNKIDSSSQELTNNLNSKSQELTDSLNSKSQELTENIDSLSKDYHDDSANIWAAINALKKRTTAQENGQEFIFGYEHGCYGYYVGENTFKPF